MTEAELFEELRLTLLWEEAFWTGQWTLPLRYDGPIEIKADPLLIPTEWIWSQEALEAWPEDSE